MDCVAGKPDPYQFVKIPNRIFVGGISFNTTKEELQEFFKRYGAVRDAKIISDHEGVSKGYGFVTFYKEEVAMRLLNMGTIYFKAKKLNVGEAFRKRTQSPYDPRMLGSPVATTEANPCFHQGGVTANQAVYYNSYYYYSAPTEVSQQQQLSIVPPGIPGATGLYQPHAQHTVTVYPGQNWYYWVPM